MATATCDIRFSLQNRYANDNLVDELAELGISNRAVTFSGRATLSEKTIKKDEFISAKPGDIHTRLTKFLDDHHLPRVEDLVILDMEPKEIAPRNLGEFEGKQQRDLVAAYRLRISVARQVLQGTQPGVRIGMYQVVVPDGKGRPFNGFERRMCGYLAAGRLGMYDELDFICPVLYQRFGSDDADPNRLRRWIAAATRQGIYGSLALTRSNGDRIPLVPILSFWVFNGRSANKREAVTPVSVARQLRIVQDAVEIEAILFWSGWQTTEEMKGAKKPVEAIDINQFLISTGSLPWPGCV
jgi:hypothetical protein